MSADIKTALERMDGHKGGLTAGARIPFYMQEIAELRAALAATIAPAQASQDEQDEFRKWIFSDGNEDIFVKSAWSAWQARAKLAAQSASPKSAAPSSLAKQIADAKAEYDSWTPEKRASVKLEGSSEPTRGSVGRKNPL